MRHTGSCRGVHPVPLTSVNEDSIQASPRRLERILNKFDARFALAVVDNFHNVESIGDFGIVQHSQPDLRASGDLPFLKRFDVV